MAHTTESKRKDDKGTPQGMAESAVDKAKDLAGNVGEKAKEVASNVGEKAKNLASAAADRADSAVSSVGSGMESLGGTIRDKAPQSGVLGQAASGVASALESSGHYLEEHGLSGVAEDLTSLIRRNPIPALLIGIGLGFLLARMTRS